MKKIYMILAAMTLLTMSLNAQVLLTGWDYGSSFPSTWTVPSTGSGSLSGSLYISNQSGGDIFIPTSDLQGCSTVTVKVTAGKENTSSHTLTVNSVATSSALTQALVEYEWTNVNATSGITIHFSDWFVDFSSIKVYGDNPNPTIIASPNSVSLSSVPGSSVNETVTVSGLNLTGNISTSISGTDASLFSVTPTSLGTTGGNLTVTYSPTAVGTHTATLTLSSTGADPVTITLNGECTQDVTLCDGTNTSTYLPFYGSYVDNYQVNQMIYPEISSLIGKKITSMTFYASAAIDANIAAGTWTIKLGTTSQSTFASQLSSVTRLVPTDVQAVVSGYHFTTGANTLTIVFDTPFVYNGGNLLIVFQEKAYTSAYKSVTFYGVNQGSNVTGYNSYGTGSIGTNGHYSGGGTRTFLPKVTFTFEEIEPQIVASPETLTINDSGTNNTFTVQGTNLGGDNVGLTQTNSQFDPALTATTGTTYYGEGDNGKYWGFTPADGSVNGTVAMNYNGRDLSASETVTLGNNLASATVTVNYRADLYVVGDFGNGWDFSTGTLMTYNATNNTYTTNVTVNANNLILFARKLGESNPWNTRYVFGPNSDGDWWVNGDNATGTIDLYDDDPIKFVNAGTYTIEINATTGALTIYKMVLPPPENVVATPDGTNATVTCDVPSNLPTAIGPYTEDFEDTSKFPSFSLGGITASNHNGAVGGWTLYDSTGAQVYGDQDEDFENEAEPQAWMVFNSTSVGAPAHSGAQYMESICPLSSYGAADSWLISPELSGNAQTITFYEHVLSDSWGNELYEVLVSSTDNDPASFTSIKTFADVNLTWTLQTADLPAGTKYFAIRHYSNNVFGLLVDDITYEGATPVPVYPVSYNVYLDGVLVGNVDANDPRSYDFSNLSSGEHNCAVSAVYEGGVESEQVPAQFTIVPKTDAPAITVTASGGSYTITATGNGTVTLTVGDQTVSGEGTVSITIPRTDADQTVTATATAQETGKLPSDPATREVTIPALPVDPTPESIGLLRLHLLFCDQLKEAIPDDNSHPDAYGYVLRWEPNGPTGDDARESGRVRVNIQKTDCEVLGYYTLDQIDMDKNIGINHDQGLTMDVTTAQVKFNLSSSNDKLNYYYLQGEENGLPELGEDYLSQLHRQEDFTYREMYTESAEFDEVFENGTHYYFNGGTPILTGVYGDATKYVSYAPSVTTWGIERRYFELDGYDNTYGGPIWKTSVGKVEMDTHDVTLKAERQTNASHSVNWTDENNQAASVYILDGIGAIGLLPHTDLTEVEFEPYMFRVFVESPNGKLRNYKFVDADPTNTTQPGEHAEGVTTSEADAKGPLCVWSGYVDYDEDGNMILEDSENGVSISTGTYENGQTTYIYHKNKVDRPAPTVVTDPETGETTTTVASWEKDKNNAMFGALDDVAISGYNQQTGEPILKQQIDPEDLTVFVRFYFNVKGMAAGHVPMGRAGEAARPGNGSESPGFAPEPWTAVNEVVYNGEVVSRTYVNALGMQSDQPFDGVNIVVTRYSDGKVSTTKVVH